MGPSRKWWPEPDQLFNAGHTVKVERRTHSAVEGYKRVNVRVK